MSREKKIKWYYQPRTVLVLLFFVLGPFALPLLYESPQFSKFWKVLLTIVVIIFTIYLTWASVEIWRRVLEFMAVINRGY